MTCRGGVATASDHSQAQCPCVTAQDSVGNLPDVRAGSEPGLEARIQARLHPSHHASENPHQWQEKAREVTFLEHLLSDWFIGDI